ncbi:NUDIX domain-containing protein [Mesobacillus jeotgali]|uniref:NUDIX domain-containing protein n=1 Tax=Mesobacillus jeotgali TaxID=129985 RepID=A0ABY9VNK9_9BACI|nr:NUDIX domain-containing protein [Mesobacillus jeotgali]WNF24734.1 NUDIX domain-containing protein [Mesobacillus jeotgali]
MIKRYTYQAKPERLDDINRFFHTHIYPIQIKNGAKLIGRWVNDTKNEILVIWEYTSKEQYERIESLLKSVKPYDMDFYTDADEDFMSSTAPYPSAYHPPKHLLSVSGYVTNQDGEVLLVRNFHRSDTMEMPGGQVEEGETLEAAIHREVFEETGITVNLLGITGIYQNVTIGVTCVVFRGEYQSGEVRTAEGETSEVFFTKLTRENIEQFITRKQFRDRALDAMDANYIPYEAFKARPYELIRRFDVIKEYS